MILIAPNMKDYGILNIIILIQINKIQQHHIQKVHAIEHFFKKCRMLRKQKFHNFLARLINRLLLIIKNMYYIMSVQLHFQILKEIGFKKHGNRKKIFKPEIFKLFLAQKQCQAFKDKILTIKSCQLTMTTIRLYIAVSPILHLIYLVKKEFEYTLGNCMIILKDWQMQSCNIKQNRNLIDYSMKMINNLIITAQYNLNH